MEVSEGAATAAAEEENPAAEARRGEAAAGQTGVQRWSQKSGRPARCRGSQWESDVLEGTVSEATRLRLVPMIGNMSLSGSRSEDPRLRSDCAS